ncbi:DUF4364 family protein [Tissierella carlieri]|uniref:DUF4364 family protein n=1 Tax=Tissierella carlieri TaxID=689904 RepID=A0ABT1SE33_9FIRM|nr:DUF4364 family protein [Tissierella carlieri]MBU5313464.1 DUF4364 family protein [Tissierella carlieri]MCQ4924747.1 DUF4364 family protein [Tissierella carlieri]
MFIENTEELAQNKLLLLYLIKSAATVFTNTEITEFVLEKNYMNFFLVQQYLSELVESNFIEIINKNSKEVYSILEKGEIALSYFEDRIPNKIKEELNKEFNRIEKKNKIETQVVADYFEKENNQYVVNLKLMENEDTLFSLYLDVATKKQVDLICNRWKENPEFIYQNIINILTNEKTTPLE